MNQSLKKDELVTSQLRTLFESRGFSQAKVNPFEEYELYVDNKNFLDTQRIITFTDTDGRLMALKPDVTLSIVKNITPGELKSFEKLFYIDDVCRVARNGEYKLLRQVGVELIGPHDGFVNLEILDLALSCLSAISDECILDISHLGFVSGLLETAPLNFTAKSRLIEALHAKSPHQVKAILDENGVNGGFAESFIKLISLTGPILEILPRAKEIAVSPAMYDVWDELHSLSGMLEASGIANRVNLDFSVVNDLDYYNGLIFRGYVKGVPDVVLNGGRYDHLMRRMGKKSGAIGFAVYLSELNSHFKSGKTYDFDILLSYDPDCDFAALLALSKKWASEGKSVRLERIGAKPRCSCLERFHFGKDGLAKEIELC